MSEGFGPNTYFHITSKAKFKIDPNYAPEDNAIAITDRSGHKGIYLTNNVERWVNGHGYVRPFVAEIVIDPSVLEHDRISRYGGEVFVPASQFHKINVTRVMPIDAWCREEFGAYGWFERAAGFEFDTGEAITAKDWETPFRGWRYPDDVRTMSAEEVRVLKKRFAVGLKARG